MVKFNARIQKFAKKGEKTGWSYIEISRPQANKLKKGVKTSYRVKGTLDSLKISKVAIIPMGDGKFIIPVNGQLRKKLGKRAGDVLTVVLEADDSKYILSPDLMACLKDEPSAMETFKSLPGSYQRYYSKWVEGAKTVPTKTRRIMLAVVSLSNKETFQQMMRSARERNQERIRERG